MSGYVEIDVNDKQGNQHTVLVMTAPMRRDKLIIECTTESLDVLKLQPDAGEALTQFRPDIKYPNVTYLPYRQAIKASYYDPIQKKTCTKSLSIKATTPELMQERTDKNAHVLNEWFVTNAPADQHAKMD